MKMFRRLPLIKMFCKNDGSVILEFALISPMFFLLLFGVIEFGLYTYHSMAIERIAVDVARAASIGKVNDASSGCPNTTTQLDYINCIITQKSAGLINGNRIKTQVQLLSNGTTRPDICLANPDAPDSRADCGQGNRYEEINGITGYQGEAASNFGGAGQPIEVLIYFPWTVQIPLFNQFFGSENNKGVVMIAASTVIRNEPD